jgi:non-ribosomal peptide synthetase component F
VRLVAVVLAQLIENQPRDGQRPTAFLVAGRDLVPALLHGHELLLTVAAGHRLLGQVFGQIGGFGQLNDLFPTLFRVFELGGGAEYEEVRIVDSGPEHPISAEQHEHFGLAVLPSHQEQNEPESGPTIGK